MNGKYLVGAVIEAVIKVIVIAVVVMFVFRTATTAYDFGYKVFADKPVSVSGGRTITVGIAESASVKDIAQMLEEKGLIEDARLFVVQELLSAYHGEILPGIYDLSTSMTAEEMLAVMSTPAEESKEEDDDVGESVEESEEIENTEGMTAE
ncbi:MAG: endolytic transglycosylase MltG [Lachnospiraceae bacterium]|nr:endolytic transglycosylase MltG [Lachnospiraceae bacterium]MDD7629126.1 endolytic transglycosylase MltG [Lachnospiraceae bacterium]MDY4118684.1 endolytic transglycosylase MltG [Lachnospiraceae bacterium]